MDTSSPAHKKIALSPEDEEPIVGFIEKIANADMREELKTFFHENGREKPGNIPHSVWNIICGLGEILNLVVGQIHTKNSVVENVPDISATDRPSDQNWSEVGPDRRRRARPRKNTEIDVSYSTPNFLDAVREQERLRSGVLCHIAESSAPTPRDREIDDENKVRSIIHKIDSEVKVDRIYRLGAPKKRPPTLDQSYFLYVCDAKKCH